MEYQDDQQVDLVKRAISLTEAGMQNLVTSAMVDAMVIEIVILREVKVKGDNYRK